MHSTGTIPRRWSIADSREIYSLRQWGGRYFEINESGHLVAFPANGVPSSTATPTNDGLAGIDLKELVDEVRERGIGLPLLIRFPEILKSRIVDLNEAFRTAITEYGYRGVYRGVYPIKVNQDRYVVEQIVHYGRPYHYGLEAGSKPELLAVLAMLEDEEALIICNGYKDAEYVETALLGSKLGRNIILVVEKFSELPLIAALSKKHGIRPHIGDRDRNPPRQRHERDRQPVHDLPRRHIQPERDLARHWHQLVHRPHGWGAGGQQPERHQLRGESDHHHDLLC